MVDVKPVRTKNEERIAIALGMQQSAERSRDKAEKGLRAAQADNVSLREQLAEAQATIEKVRAVPHGEFGPWDDDVASWGLITAALDGPLSAPSSTPKYEYATTTGPRKAWDNPDEPPGGEGWELDPDRGRAGESWERFDYHEERYWRRLKSAPSSTGGEDNAE